MKSRANPAGLPLFAAVLIGSSAVFGGEWEDVQRILSGTRDILVLDGGETAPVRSPGTAAPEYGDWLVRHFLSDPESFNPFTSSDAGASSVRDYIFESLLSPRREPPYKLEGLIAEGYPEIGDDHLKYTFDIRPGVHFSDGKPLTAADVLFSMKVIQHPEVLAPHLRNYFNSVSDARIEGESRISFFCKEPYFRNDLMLGGFSIIPKHFYDSEGLLDRVSISSLIDGTWEQGEHAGSARAFARRFNRDFNRAVLGSGPYFVEDFDRDVVTQQKVVLTRNRNYWARDKGIVPASGFVDRIVFKVINNTDAAFIELTNGNLDLYALRPLEFKEKSWTAEFQQRFLKVI
ncbi:MAG: ABC transporter substrate-binding protein, partial [Gemmatimonadetes bacterium]|nr:ABC transporter substrate-binding protein [Gemmatimonadota bacterium]